MNIEAEQVAYKRRIGKIGTSPIIELGTIGGLILIISTKDGKSETLGMGPHIDIAKFIAQKKSDNKIEFTDLSKSDWVDPAHFQHLLPRYEALTDALRKRQGF